MTILDQLFGQLSGYPWDKWIYITKPGLPIGNIPVVPLYWRQISASGGHQAQLAFYSPIDINVVYQMPLVANCIYVVTATGDTPNLGTSGDFIEIQPPCANWYSTFFEESPTPQPPPAPVYVTRDQSGKVKTAIRGNRQLSGKVKTAISQYFELNHSFTTTIAGNPQLLAPISAVIQGEAEIAGSQKVAIRGEIELDSSISTAIAHDFHLPSNLLAAIRGNPLLYNHYRAAIKGENGLSGTLKVFIVKNREEEIMLELEGKFPQELALTSIKNAASKTRNWATQPIS